MYRFERLIAWQRGMDLVESVYAASQAFPADERFGLTSELRRAGTSIPLNIAEGSACKSRKEFAYFLGVALRSQYELATALRIALRLKYLPAEDFAALDGRAAEVGRLTQALLNSVSPANADRIAESPAVDDDHASFIEIFVGMTN